MTTARMDEILSIMTPDEVHDALWLMDVFERWSMSADEAEEWRRRIVGSRRFMDLRSASSKSDL